MSVLAPATPCQARSESVLAGRRLDSPAGARCHHDGGGPVVPDVIKRFSRARRTWWPGPRKAHAPGLRNAGTGTPPAGSTGCAGRRGGRLSCPASDAVCRRYPARGLVSEIRAASVLPAKRTPITLHTQDGLRLVGELAVPACDRPRPGVADSAVPAAPTPGRRTDTTPSLPKASYRLPALADLAVLRFNTRGTSSERGTSDGAFGDGEAERFDVAAAIGYAVRATARPLAARLVVRHRDRPRSGGSGPTGAGPDHIEGAILLSPPLRRAGRPTSTGGPRPASGSSR